MSERMPRQSFIAGDPGEVDRYRLETIQREIESQDLVHRALAALDDVAEMRGKVLVIGTPWHVLNNGWHHSRVLLTKRVATRSSDVWVAVWERDNAREFLKRNGLTRLLPSRAPSRAIELLVLGHEELRRSSDPPDLVRVETYRSERDAYAATLGWPQAKRRRPKKSTSGGGRRDRVPSPPRNRKRFEKLGTPFPLFEGPANDALLARGATSCASCGAKDRHAPLLLSSGSELSIACAECGAEARLDADELEESEGAWDCPECDGENVASLHDDAQVAVCRACLSSGRARIRHETEKPIRAKRDREALARTPEYTSWQDHGWLVCCRAPMVFLGKWGWADFERAAPGRGRERFLEIVEASDAVHDLWERLPPHIDGRSPVVPYVFRCQRCERRRGYWDAS